MKLRTFLLIALIMGGVQVLSAETTKSYTAMDTLPFYQIPEAPTDYDAASVTARLIEGLGYRYYWATEGLRDEDLAYEPGNEGANCAGVLEHILGLTRFVLRTLKREIHDNSVEYPTLTWEEQRRATLMNLKEASDILRNNKEVADARIIFKRGEKTSEYPFWNLVNGPISDAIYHTGQIVSYRRSSGNPIDPNVSVFRGKTRE